MKKLLIVLMPLLSLGSYAQTDTTEFESDSIEIKTVQLPDSTGLGAADGKLVSKQIDSSGGTIISDDKRVELIFPPGALATATTISIQPIVNLIPNGNGKGYQFEPSGIHFQKPVQVVFHYSDEEAATCPPELQFMAIQNPNGKWEYLSYDGWDSAAKSLKGYMSHFSAMLDGMLMKLSPNQKTLKVGQSFSLSLTAVVEPGEDELPPLRSIGADRRMLWFVKGGRTFGTLSVNKTDKLNATYHTPSHLIGKNPEVILQVDHVTIERVRQFTRHKKGIWRGTTDVPHFTKLAEFSCDINLYDEYKVHVNYHIDAGDNSWVDNASFVLRISNDVTIEDGTIHNQHLEWLGKRGCCSWLNEASCDGPVDVTGVQTAKVVPDPGSGNARVIIDRFTPAKSQSLTPSVDCHLCKGGKPTPVPPNPGVSLPFRLSFVTINTRQLLRLDAGYGTPITRENRDHDITATIEPMRN